MWTVLRTPPGGGACFLSDLPSTLFGVSSRGKGNWTIPTLNTSVRLLLDYHKHLYQSIIRGCCSRPKSRPRPVSSSIHLNPIGCCSRPSIIRGCCSRPSIIRGCCSRPTHTNPAPGLAAGRRGPARLLRSLLLAPPWSESVILILGDARGLFQL